jgi:hypothetical protein
LSFHEITGGIPIRRKDPPVSINGQLEEAEENFRRLQTQHKRVVQILHEHRPPPKARLVRKKKRTSQHNRSLDFATNPEGRHYHLDMNTIPFILGQSTSPSHNVKTNVQKVKIKKTKKSFFLFENLGRCFIKKS